MDNRKIAPAVLMPSKAKTPRSRRKAVTGIAPEPRQKQLVALPMVLTEDETVLLRAYRRMGAENAGIIFSLSMTWAMREDAEKKQRIAQPRFHLIVGGGARSTGARVMP